MDFTFSEDQLLFQDSVRDFLRNEVSTDTIRARWETETGRSDTVWQQLAELGLIGMLVPEAFGGLGMNEVDFVLLAQECGYVALPEPLVHNALVAVPLLIELGDSKLQETWLPRVAAGEARIAVGLRENLFVEDAHIADLLILQHADELHVVLPEHCELSFNESVDPSRKLFSVAWDPSLDSCVARSAQAKKLLNATMNRGALACAAQALGLTQRMLDISVQYTSERQQFGKPIGSFQAVKHHMANVAFRWEYARAPVSRAAYAIAHQQQNAAMHVSHAKFVACEAAELAAKNAIQVHGAMGYTWEVDLHIFMKRAWALSNSWGDMAFHKARVAEHIFADGAALGAGATFG